MTIKTTPTDDSQKLLNMLTLQTTELKKRLSVEKEVVAERPKPKKKDSVKVENKYKPFLKVASVFFTVFSIGIGMYLATHIPDMLAVIEVIINSFVGSEVDGSAGMEYLQTI